MSVDASAEGEEAEAVAVDSSLDGLSSRSRFRLACRNISRATLSRTRGLDWPMAPPEDWIKWDMGMS